MLYYPAKKSDLSNHNSDSTLNVKQRIKSKWKKKKLQYARRSRNKRRQKEKEREGWGRFREWKETKQRLSFGLLNIRIHSSIHWILKRIDMQSQWVSMPQWLGASASKSRIREQCQDKSCLGAKGIAFVSFCLGMSGNVTLKRIQSRRCSAAVPYTIGTSGCSSAVLVVWFSNLCLINLNLNRIKNDIV